MKYLWIILSLSIISCGNNAEDDSKNKKADSTSTQDYNQFEGGELEDKGLAEIQNGQAFLDQGKYDSALIQFEIAEKIVLDLKGNHQEQTVDVYQGKGICYLSMKEYEKAVLQFSETMKYQESHFGAYFNRAYCHQVLGNYPEALKDYSSAILIEPERPAAYIEKARILIAIGESDSVCWNLEFANSISGQYALNDDERSVVDELMKENCSF